MKGHNKHSTKEKKEEEYYSINKKTIYIVLAAIAIILIGFYAWGFLDDFAVKTNSTVSDDSIGVGTTQDSIALLVVNDKRCTTCDISGLIPQLEELLGDLEVTEVDYSSEEGQKAYEDYSLTTLPALLFSNDVQESARYSELQPYLDPAGDLVSLRIGANYDPNAEICNNGMDDTGNGKIDCEDSDCSGQWICVEKLDKPVVELFIMSHCPYGTQMEKGILPVAKLLGDKIDFQLKFVNYAMHGELEINEQLNQYCIEQEYPEKQLDYLGCFLGKTGSAADGASCMTELGIDSSVIASCVADADAEFGVTAGFEDKSQWMGSYPPFDIHDADNQKYSVRGSPTLIINGVEPAAGRDSASLLDAICYAFNSEPEECSTTLSSGTPSPGFGIGTTTSENLAACGG